jgi:hypothetical protein
MSCFRTGAAVVSRATGPHLVFAYIPLWGMVVDRTALRRTVLGHEVNR